MRLVNACLFLAGMLSLCIAGYAESDNAYRVLPDVNSQVFACSANPSHHVFSSEAELKEELKRLSRFCRPGDFQKREAAFLASLQSAGIQWQRESLAVVSEWYGTGMAKGRMEMCVTQPGILDVFIVWKLPPPPHTPDTAVYRGVFAVKKTAINKIRVHGKRDSVTEFSTMR